MEKWEAYVTGYCYGLLSNVVGEDYDPRHGRYRIALLKPWIGFTEIQKYAMARGLVTFDLQMTISELMSTIDATSVSPLETANCYANSYWSNAYNLARAGYPIPNVVDIDISYARRLKKLTQEELAEKVGTTVDIIKAWEKGDMKPSTEYKEKLKEVLL